MASDMIRSATVMLAVALAACHSYTPATSRAVEPKRDVRVRLAAPRDVAARTSSGDTTRVAGAWMLEGRVVASRNDSLHLRTSSARDASGRPIAVPRHAVVALPLSDVAAVDLRRVDAGRTAFAVLGGVATVFLVALVAALGSFDPLGS